MHTFNPGFQAFALTPNVNHDILFNVEQGIQRYDSTLKFEKMRYGLTHLGRYGDLSSDSSIVYETIQTKGRTNPMSSPATPVDGEPRKLEYDATV